MKLKFRPLLFSVLLIIMLSVILCGCSKNEDDNDDNEPGSEFSGSLSGGNGNGDQQPDTPKDEGDPDTVYYIDTAEDLLNMKRKGKYVLRADVDMTGREWTPIGSYEAPFCGSFDGNGHKIIGISVEKAAEDVGISAAFKYSYCGLFGYASGAEIKDLTLENAQVDVSESAQNRSIYAGLLGGYFSECKLTNATVSGSVCVVSSNDSGYAGGIAGGITKTKAEKCVSSASVKTDRCPTRAYSGGLFAIATDKSSIIDSSASGDVYASSTVSLAYAGGLVGYCYTTEVTTSYSSSKVYSEVSSTDSENGKLGAAYSGGLAAVASSIPTETENDETINNCIFLRSYYIGSEVTANGGKNTAYCGGLVSKSDYTTFTHCYSSTVLKASSDTETASAAGISTVISEFTKINGCFFIGNTEIMTKKLSLAKCGTLYAQVSSKEVAENIVSSAYSSSNSCVINGNTYKCVTENSDKIKLNGKARISGTFSDLDTLASELGWSVSEWTIAGSLPKPV